jgi:hypothetical protein
VVRETSRYAWRMKIFLSWSTEPSKFIAEALKEWIPNVIQVARPWFSDSDIDRGTRWSAEIATELENSRFGIICLTPENTTAPWINFEAGALAKTLTKTYVVPLLFELEPADLVGPLSQFNAARINRDDMQKLMLTINKALENPLDASVVEKSFEMWWPELEKKIGQVPKVKLAKKDKRSDRDILEEILGLVRSDSTSLSVISSRKDTVGVELPLSRPVKTRIENYTVQSIRDKTVLESGHWIYHEKFGAGKILATSGNGDKREAMIAFNEVGNKKLLLKYTPMRIILEVHSDADQGLEEFPPDEELPF